MKRSTAPTRLKLTRPDPSEDELHKSVADLLLMALMPPAMFSTFPSGMYQLPKASGGRLKAYGLKEGMPDIFVLHDRRVVWIELKRRHGIVSKVQQAMHEKLEENKTSVYVCRSPEAVIDALMREGFPLRKGIVATMLHNPYEPAERQCTGDPYFGTADTRAEAGNETQPKKVRSAHTRAAQKTVNGPSLGGAATTEV